MFCSNTNRRRFTILWSGHQSESSTAAAAAAAAIYIYAAAAATSEGIYIFVCENNPHYSHQVVHTWVGEDQTERVTHASSVLSAATMTLHREADAFGHLKLNLRRKPKKEEDIL